MAPKISSPSARETPDESQTARRYRLPAIAELWTAKTQQSDEDFGGPPGGGRTTYSLALRAGGRFAPTPPHVGLDNLNIDR